MGHRAMSRSSEPQPKSWAEALHAYQRAKLLAPAPVHALPPPRCNPARRISPLNPVTGELKRSESAAQLQPVRELLRRQPSYDIIGHVATANANTDATNTDTDSDRTSSQSRSRAPAHSHASEWNIVNNRWLYADSQARTEAADAREWQRLRVKRATKAKYETRDYNTINHYYYRDDESKQQLEQQARTDAIEREIASTLSYDPIKARFYDGERERQFQQQRRQAECEHGVDKMARMPAFYKRRDDESHSSPLQ